MSSESFLRTAFDNFLNSLPPPILEESGHVIKEIAIERFSPFFLVITTGEDLHPIERETTGEQDIINELVSYIPSLLERLKEKQERDLIFCLDCKDHPEQYDSFIESIKILTEGKCGELMTDDLLSYAQNSFAQDIVIKETYIRTPISTKIIISKDYEKLANILGY